MQGMVATNPVHLYHSQKMNVSNVNFAARTLRLRMPRVCVAVASTDIAEMVDRAEALVRENSLLEFRLDYLSNPVAALPRIKRLLDFRPDVIAIATCRRTIAGGRFRGSLHTEVEVLKKAAEIGFQAIDIELETAEALKPEEFEKLRDLAAVIVSHHDFKTTKHLDETFDRMVKFPADFYKVVGTATCLYDNVEMMKFLQRTSDNHAMIGVCMGEQGLISRVLALRAGSICTFASTGEGEETAPGQIQFRALREQYRVEQVDAVTKVYGVVGDPIAHSMSPAIFNSAFRYENVNAVYLALHAKKLSDLLACLRDIPLSGCSVTMPYKQEILPHLDNSDQLTQQTGACNTLVRGQDGRVFGFNTDVYGLVAALEARVTLRGAKILVLGAGGAARAAVFGCKARGAEVFITNRTSATAVALARKAEINYIKRQDVAKSQFDVIINATPVGMGANKHSPLEEKELNARYIFDLVYNPVETKLIKMAKAKGLHTISGVEMFVHQAARQFEIWTGKPAPVEGMRQVVMRKLGIQAAAEAATQPAASEPEHAPVAETPTPEAETAKVAQKAQAAVPSNGNGVRATKAAPAKSAKAAPVKSVKKDAVSAKPLTSAKKAAGKDGSTAKPAAKKAAHKPAKPQPKKAKSR
jgi:3-dehydroquinate dehydratase/shikimate dehydrogenase